MRGLELFCCAGGMAEGFRRAGLTFMAAFDADPDACASYAANLQRPVQMCVHDLLYLILAGWRCDALDLIVADPPCTPWSRAGKRQGLADGRDMLRVTVDIIRLLQPRAYLIGNVPGLQDSSNRNTVRAVLAPLAVAGYCTRDFAELDAADYGVPQHRVRPFWFGHKDGGCVQWPRPTHGPSDANLTFDGLSLSPWISCAEALGHLSVPDIGRTVKLKWNAYDAKKGGHQPSDPGPARIETTPTKQDPGVAAI